MKVIKWIRAMLYHGIEEERVTGHLFLYGDRSLSIRQLKIGRYPPFDCVELDKESAVHLRDFLNECLKELE